ncbi:MAG: MerR family DNA-binding transcriptional regulator, partial [Chloroflexi bacterium]|nr:MerR family DNA-binding transcriptional regulator [Chloroflexota bacterium]
MKNGLRIGKLGRQLDIPAYTIRYYERLGLIPQPS